MNDRDWIKMTDVLLDVKKGEILCRLTSVMEIEKLPLSLKVKDLSMKDS